MSRNQLLAVGALALYAIFAVDAIVHLGSGEWAQPVVVMIAAVVCTALVTRRRARRLQPEVAA